MVSKALWPSWRPDTFAFSCLWCGISLPSPPCDGGIVCDHVRCAWLCPQQTQRVGTWGQGLAGVVVLGCRLDLMILEVFSNLSDSVTRYARCVGNAGAAWPKRAGLEVSEARG